MKEPIWVLRDVILAYHDLLLAKHGRASGIRDEGLLDSAIDRPIKRSLYESLHCLRQQPVMHLAS